MKHRIRQRSFGRPIRQRTALLRGLARALILEERIETSVAKAKELKPFVEKLITHAKKDTLAARRVVVSRIGSEDTAPTGKLFMDLAKRYTDRNGGYTRITKLGQRDGDAGQRAIIEFV